MHSIQVSLAPTQYSSIARSKPARSRGLSCASAAYLVHLLPVEHRGRVYTPNPLNPKLYFICLYIVHSLPGLPCSLQLTA